ncbi:hypothetical protein, variant [Verruconis gallopava]|uniref:NAD(P)-binding protein n=1 Tax=Verruconis gallopava TaxID=253628 RepID=A0A0D2ALX7_9PEZI|nr:hypothetical protein, variant [Verruconis gallopava]KIW00129.1 hypothetical protein, variant [Verruconis gallopava]
MASKVKALVKNAPNEPLITGALLYVLTKGPASIRARLLAPFDRFLRTPSGAARLASFVTALKVLTAIGVLKKVSAALDALAWNNWSLRRRGAPFKFGPLKEELVVITGGSSGFGYEMVKGFSKCARVVVLDVQDFPPELARLPDVHFYKCDVTDTPAVEALCKAIKEEHGEATVLVNNAGIGIGKTVLETTNAESERLFKVNLISHFVLIREFLPGMLKKRKGHIVTIASMASFVAAPGLLDYCCSKVGALYVSEGIRAECLSRYPGGEGICTTSIHPSWHQTGILKGAEKALKKYGIVPDPASNVSDKVIEQVLKGRSGRITVPESEKGKMSLREYPMWVQDILYGYVWKPKGRFQFGKDDDSKLV